MTYPVNPWEVATWDGEVPWTCLRGAAEVHKNTQKISKYILYRKEDSHEMCIIITLILGKRSHL
jgi:hypothetical protein